MANRKNYSKRQEFTEINEKDRKDMEAKEGNLDKITSDVETVRDTLDALDFKGTSEGSEQIERSIKSAEDVTTEVFDNEDNELEKIHDENQEFENDVMDRRRSTESDLGKISDSSARIETHETVNELSIAKEAVLQDIDFLSEQIERANEARKESNAIRVKLQERVNSRKRS
jgi:hypothetical protein